MRAHPKKIKRIIEQTSLTFLDVFTHILCIYCFKSKLKAKNEFYFLWYLYIYKSPNASSIVYAYKKINFELFKFAILGSL